LQDLDFGKYFTAEKIGRPRGQELLNQVGHLPKLVQVVLWLSRFMPTIPACAHMRRQHME
jgi:hypothetical protein